MPRRPDARQPALALVSASARGRSEPITDTARAAAARKVRLDPFYLEWRADRQQYCVAWYDPIARTRRRIGTGIGGGDSLDPPIEAREALAAHYTAYARPAAAQGPAEAGFSGLLTRYLDEHCSKLRAPDKPAYAARHIEAFLAEQRRAGALPPIVTVADINRKLVERYIRWRRAQGVVGETINRELATWSGCLGWAWRQELIVSRPFIPMVPEEECSGPRDLEWSPEQVAAILEACWIEPARHHVLLFAITSLSTHFRTDAILELDLDVQYKRGLLNSLPPGDRQTSKRRSVVPAAPTLAEWLEGRTGKLIQYRAPKAQRHWADPAVPEYFERPTWDIGKALSSSIVAAGLAHPSLKLIEPLLDADGNQLMQVFTKREAGTGRVPDPKPMWKPRGTPNTFRHCCQTYHQAMGTPEAQIDQASGHAGEGTGRRNYSHLRPEYLRQFITNVEAYWADMDSLTKVHRRSQVGPKVIDLATARANRTT
jgi:integrase